MFKRARLSTYKTYLKFITLTSSYPTKDVNRNFKKSFQRIMDILKKSENDYHFNAVDRMIQQFSLLYPSKVEMITTLQTMLKIEVNRFNKQTYLIQPLTDDEIKNLNGVDWRTYENQIS